jgi:hypothetical protein
MKRNVFCYYVILSAIFLVFFAPSARGDVDFNEPISVLGYGADPSGVLDSRQAFVDAINYANLVGPRRVRIPAGTYTIDNSSAGAIIVYPGMVIEGDTSGGSILQITGPGLATQDYYTSGLVIKDLKLVGSDTPYVGATEGSNHGLLIYTPTNNTAFERVSVSSFSGDGFRIRRQTGNPADKCGPCNVVFNQCSVENVWGDGWDIDGTVNAVWLAPRVKSSIGSGFHFLFGVSNQAQILITGLLWEGNEAWASKVPIWMDDATRQPMNLVGCSFVGPADGQEVIKMTGTNASCINLIGCTGSGGFSHWINDYTGENKNVLFSSTVNYFYGGISQ